MYSERYIEVTAGPPGGFVGEPSRIPIIKPELLSELMQVEPSGDKRTIEYRPCQVTLTDGAVRDHVYVVEAISYIGTWGVWPWEDCAKSSLSILDVKNIRSSPSRLPVRLANKLYARGETSMGGISYGLALRDGRTINVSGGDAVDFPAYPAGVGADDVVGLCEWKGPTQDFVGTAPYFWCLFCLEPDATQTYLENFAQSLARSRVQWRLMPE